MKLRILDGRSIEADVLRFWQAWHNAKIALITVTLYAPAAIAMLGAGWSSKHFKERRWHCFVPLVIAAIAFMCAPSPPQQPCLHARPLSASHPAACLLLAAVPTYTCCEW